MRTQLKFGSHKSASSTARPSQLVILKTELVLIISRSEEHSTEMASKHVKKPL